jgi:DNA replication protein DnaC
VGFTPEVAFARGISRGTTIASRKWHQVFPEPDMTVAAIDRLVHLATILELNVESYRRKSAERTKEKNSR